MSLLYGVRISAEISFLLSQFTCLRDRRTDGQTDGNLVTNAALHSMQRCKNACMQVCFSNQSMFETVAVGGGPRDLYTRRGVDFALNGRRLSFSLLFDSQSVLEHRNVEALTPVNHVKTVDHVTHIVSAIETFICVYTAPRELNNTTTAPRNNCTHARTIQHTDTQTHKHTIEKKHYPPCSAYIAGAL